MELKAPHVASIIIILIIVTAAVYQVVTIVTFGKFLKNCLIHNSRSKTRMLRAATIKSVEIASRSNRRSPAYSPNSSATCSKTTALSHHCESCSVSCCFMAHSERKPRSHAITTRCSGQVWQCGCQLSCSIERDSNW